MIFEKKEQKIFAYERNRSINFQNNNNQSFSKKTIARLIQHQYNLNLLVRIKVTYEK